MFHTLLGERASSPRQTAHLTYAQSGAPAGTPGG